MLELSCVFVAAFTAASTLTMGVRWLATRHDLLDQPHEERKVHEVPTPTSGGVAIAGGMIAGLLLWMALTSPDLSGVGGSGVLIVVGALLMLAVGFLDDIRGISVKGKFLAQLVAAYLLLHAGFYIDLAHVPYLENSGYQQALFSIPLSLLWIVGVINAVNLIDGLDGLAAGIVAIAFAALATIYALQGHTELVVTAAIAIAAIGGFLIHNFNPATIFMGDSGSLLLGYLLAAFSLTQPGHLDLNVALLIPVMVLGLPILDTSTAIFRRLRARRGIFAPDTEHIHHLLSRRWSVPQAVLALYGAGMWFGSAAIMMTLLPAYWAFAVSAVTGVVALLWLRRVYAGAESVPDAASLKRRAPLFQLHTLVPDIFAYEAISRSKDNDRRDPPLSQSKVSTTGLHEDITDIPNHDHESMNLQQRIRVSSALEVVELDGELAVLNVDDGYYYGLNQTGAQILNMAQQNASLGDVLDALLEKYAAVEASQLEEDVEAFLVQMEKYGMLRVESSEE